MAINTKKQYTIRNIPERVDRVLKQRARANGKSFNETVLEALVIGSGEVAIPKRDLSFIAGSISEDEAGEMEAEVKAQRQIDSKLWT
jgi:hypothetical protein